MENKLIQFFSENKFQHFRFCSKDFIISLIKSTDKHESIFLELLEISKILDFLQIKYQIDTDGHIHLNIK